MKTSEFRLGNIVRTIYGYDNEVKMININDITVGKNYRFGDATGYYPKKRTNKDLATGNFGMPLTESWLQLFKMEYYDGRYVVNKYFTYIHSTSSGFYLEDGPGNTISIRLEFVHQLQNLYFALTGEELEIKL